MLAKVPSGCGWAIAVGDVQPHSVLCRDCGQYHRPQPSPCSVLRTTMHDAAGELLGTWPRGKIDRETKTGKLRFTRHRHDHATAGTRDQLAAVLLLLHKRGML